jgi:hypothetical protein
MRVKSFFILLIGVTFLAVSFKPIYLMLREAATEKAVMDSYVVRHDAEKCSQTA